MDNNIQHDLVKIELLEQDILSAPQTIHFFDDLAKKGLGAAWRLVDVKQLTFKKDKKEKGELVENEEEEETIEDIEDTGITQAILEGKNLRENPFVKQLENSGYRFTAMTYEYEHKKESLFIQIKAEFKGRPKVFEVGVVNSEKNTHIGKVPNTLTPKQNMEFRSIFWNEAKIIFDNLIKKK